MAGAGLVSRGLTKVRELVASATHFGKPPEADDLDQIRTQLQECAEGRGGEVSTRQRAARLAETYLRLDAAGREKRAIMLAEGKARARHPGDIGHKPAFPIYQPHSSPHFTGTEPEMSLY